MVTQTRTVVSPSKGSTLPLVPTATPELYAEFVNQGGAAAFVSLLSHENNDIVGQVTELLRDMTDDDAVEDQARLFSTHS